MKLWISRLPFTLLMLVVLSGLGIYGQTHIGPLDADVRRGAGFSTQLLFDGHLHRVLTSLFFTTGGWKFYASLLMFAACVGWIGRPFSREAARNPGDLNGE